MEAVGTWARLIIVNHNSGQLLQGCMNALAAQTMPQFQVVVVDNASNDSSATALHLPDSRFRLHLAGANLGFAAANNLAAADCEAEYSELAPEPGAAPGSYAAVAPTKSCDATTSEFLSNDERLLTEREALALLDSVDSSNETSAQLEVLPVLPAGGIDLRAHLNAIEKELIRQALERSRGTVAHAARLLGLRRTTLVEKLRKFELVGSDATSED